MSKDKDVQTDLRRIRTSWQELLEYLRAIGSGGGLTEAEANALYLLRAGNDWSGFGSTAPQATDRILLESAAAGFDKRYAEYQDFDPWRNSARPLFAVPASPNAADKEFLLDSDVSGVEIWDQAAGAAVTPSGAIDRFNAIVGTNPRENLPSVGRPSFYKLQVPSTASFHFVTWPLTLPDPGFVWARFGYAKQPAQRSEFGVFGSTGGHVDTNYWMVAGAFNAGGVSTMEERSANAGVDTGTGTTISANSPGGDPQWDYVGIYRSGTSYRAFLFSDSGEVSTFAAVNNVGLSPTRWGFRIRQDTFPAVLLVDFMRLSSSTLGILE